jgi:hypothetical protein
MANTNRRTKPATDARLTSTVSASPDPTQPLPRKTKSQRTAEKFCSTGRSPSNQHAPTQQPPPYPGPDPSRP